MENILQRQTAYADAVAGLPLPALRRLLSLTVLNLPLFVRVTENNGFLTKSLLTKRLHAQFVFVR